MAAPRWTYDWMYRLGVAPYDVGVPHPQLVDLVDSGRVAPCRALVIACGTGTNARFLAERGFEVTAFDYSPPGIEVARKRAAETGIDVDFRVDDATEMATIEGQFGLITDCGSLSDIGAGPRQQAWARMAEHLAPDGAYFHWGFEYAPDWTRPWRVPFANMSLRPDEVRSHFADGWEIEALDVVEGPPFRGYGCYLIRRA